MERNRERNVDFRFHLPIIHGLLPALNPIRDPTCNLGSRQRHPSLLSYPARAQVLFFFFFFFFACICSVEETIVTPVPNFTSFVLDELTGREHSH